MSNQRSGKWKTATLRDGSGMQTVTFFKLHENFLRNMVMKMQVPLF